VTEGIRERLTPVFREHGVRPTYLLSPEILRDEASVATLGGLDDCELGTHLHGEFIEPEADYSAPVTSMPQIGYSREVERAKLRNLTELFESRLGRRPLSFRAGRFAVRGHTLRVLEDLGYRVDTSVTPFRTNEFSGGLRSNHWGAPLAPYHPSDRDPRKSGSLRLVEVPVTIFAPALARWPAVLLRRLSDGALRRQPMRTIAGGAVEKFWIRPLKGSAEELGSWAEAVIAAWPPDSSAVINVMFHSVEAVPGASPYAETEREVAALLEGLASFFALMRKRYRVLAMTLSEFCRGLDG
jgi:hypothetical protein